MQTRHFVLTTEGSIREFSTEQAALIAAGANRVPEFATQKLRYLQVTLDDLTDTELKVQTAGACIRFDAEGRMQEAEPPAATDEAISRFEHDACVQWALKDLPVAPLTFH